MSSWSGGRVVLLSKTSPSCAAAWEIARQAFGASLDIHAGTAGDPPPDLLSGEAPAWLVSFLSPWIVPRAALDRAGCAINFHPASSDYPGSGCYNYALYEGAREYGAVCHVMLEKVDTGAILEERRFPVEESDTIETLKLRTMDVMLGLFRDIVACIARGAPLPRAAHGWSRAPLRFRDLDRLRRITPAMPEEEVRRRLRATTYPGWPGAWRENEDGSRYDYPVPKGPPLA